MKKFFLAVIIIVVCFSIVFADSTAGTTRIEINIPSLTLSLFKDGKPVKAYPVCVGKQSTPTPQGNYNVIYKTINPYWINKGTVVSPGPQNPLGVRWIGVLKGLGIHGNNMPESIGSLASAGCVRMYNKDVEELYTQVPANTPVSIVYDRVSVVADDYINKKAVVIYPDCYNQDNKYRNTYIGKIDNADLPQLVKDKAKKLLTSKISKPVAVSEGMGVFLNNCFITCDAFLENGDIYINCFAAKDFLGLSAELAGLYSIDVKEVEDSIYVDFTQVMECYGGKLSYDKKTSNVYANVSIVKVNGVFIGKNYGDFDKESLIDVKSFEKLGYKHDEDSIDIGLFDKHIMKVLRKSQSCVSTDNIELALGGWEQRDSLRKTVDICVPPCIKVGDEYYTTHYVDNRPVLDAETASVVRERTGIAFEAFDNGSIQDDKVIDLEAFLTGLKYTSNEFYTVIELSKQENEVGIELIP